MARIDALYLEDPCKRQPPGWWTTWPEKGFPDAAVTVSEKPHLRRNGFYGHHQEARTTSASGELSERFPCLVEPQGGPRKWIRLGKRIHLYPAAESLSHTRGCLWICSTGNVLSWKLIQTGLDTEFAGGHWRLLLTVGESPDVPTPDQGCQFTPVDFVGSSSRQRRSRSVGWFRGRCYDKHLVGGLWRTVKYEHGATCALQRCWEAENQLVPDSVDGTAM